MLVSETARTHGMYIGTSFLEAKNGHFLNTFALAAPSGKIAGMVRKRNPSIWEAYFFKGEKMAPYVDTTWDGLGLVFVLIIILSKLPAQSPPAVST